MSALYLSLLIQAQIGFIHILINILLLLDVFLLFTLTSKIFLLGLKMVKESERVLSLLQEGFY